jgi:hypothetical protein
VASRDTTKVFTLMPLSGIGNNLFYVAYIPNSKEGIEGYYCHAIKFNNVNGTMRIRTSLDIGKLKRSGTSFCHYLVDKRVYIKKAQLGTEEGLSLGWIHKVHPAFAFHDGMKEQLQAMINKKIKDIKCAFFPRTIKYKRSYGMMLMKNGVSIQVSNTANTSFTYFRAAMVDNGRA